jgi:hypothetical protein
MTHQHACHTVKGHALAGYTVRAYRYGEYQFMRYKTWESECGDSESTLQHFFFGRYKLYSASAEPMNGSKSGGTVSHLSIL